MPITPFLTPERIFLLCCLAGGLIIGQLQFSFIFSKIKKKDLRHHGTGEYGATNAFRVLGAPFGILTFLLDFGKTVLAIYIATRILPMYPELVIDYHVLVLYTGLGVVLGHIFPVYLKFNGGKGFSCTLATFFCLKDIKLIGVVILVYLVMFLVSRYVSLSSMVTVFFGAVSFMFFMLMRWTFVETDWIFDCQCALALLFVFSLIAHRSNIVRLVFGDERKFYFRKKKRLEALEEDYTNYDKYFDEVEAEEAGLASVEASLISGEAELAAEGLDEMSEAAEEAAVEAEEAAEEVVEETAEETIEAETAAEEAAENIEDVAEEVAEEAAEEVAEEVAEETAEEVTEEAVETVEETTEEVEETAEEIVESAESEIVVAEETAETTEEVAEEVTETVVETAEITEEAAEEVTEEAVETVEETTEEVDEIAEEITETETTVEQAAAAAIPSAGFFDRIKSLFRKPQQQEEAETIHADVSTEPASMDTVSDEMQETIEETDETIEDHLKTKFKDFDLTKKIGLSLGGEEENADESTSPDTIIETPENETESVAAAGFFGRMKEKLQKAFTPQEKEIPQALSKDLNLAEETSDLVEESVQENVKSLEETAEEISETVEEKAAEVTEAVEDVTETVEEVTESAEEAAKEIAEDVAAPGFFERMKSKVLHTVKLDEWKEDAQDASKEIENAASEVFGGEAAEDIQSLEKTETVDESVGDISEDAAEAIDHAAEENKQPEEEKNGFFDKIRNKFRTFDLSEKIGLSMDNEEKTNDVEDLHDDLTEKVEEIKDSAAEQMEDISDSAADMMEEIKDTSLNQTEEIKDTVVDQVEEKTEEISDDLKKKI